MATVWWVGNNQTIAQVDTLQVTAVANGATLTATINLKNVTYTCTASDTIATATAAWLSLLSAGTTPAEFQEITFTAGATTDLITCTAGTPGTPFTMTKSVAGGSAITQVHLTVNQSPSDVGLINNWLRAGTPGLPVNGDDVIVSDSDVPLLWNLEALVAIQFATFTRWQSFTGTIGLPTQNPNGYVEYRPTYFKFVGPPGGNLPMTLGTGTTGGGPSRERYNVGAQHVTLNILGSGSPSDLAAVAFLGTSVLNTFSLVSTSLAVAMNPGETSAFASASIDTGASLFLGTGVTFSGTLTQTGAQSNLFCAPGIIDARNGAAVLVEASGLAFTTVKGAAGSQITWNSNCSINTLTLTTGSIFDSSASVAAITIANSALDADCQVLDPNNCITYTNATNVFGQVTSGLFTFTGPRTVKVS